MARTISKQTALFIEAMESAMELHEKTYKAAECFGSANGTDALMEGFNKAYDELSRELDRLLAISVNERLNDLGCNEI